MATDAEAKALGFKLPVGTDFMSLGDNVIADNARAATDAIKAAAFSKPNPGPFDFDQWRTPIVTSLGAPFPEGWANVPKGIKTACKFICYGQPGDSWVAHELIQYGNEPKRLWRISKTSAAWNPWIELPMGGVPGAMASHAAWETRFMNAMGGPVDTGGLCAIALRLDHGIAPIKAKLLAGLRARTIVAAIAMNSRTWNLEENAGVPQSEVNGWVADGSVEIWNHSATHAGGLDDAGLYDEIVTGRLELEAQLPAAAPIWTFAPPGVTEGWTGFNGGNTPEAWGTVAGQLIMSSHAIAAGYVGGPLRTLDGTLRQGLTHITIERMTVAAIKAQIDQAVAARKGLQLMLHPRLLDTADAITTAQLFEVLDYVVQLRTAGQLVTLSPNRLAIADATRPKPFDSGWRDISSTVPGYISGALRIRREGDDVWVQADNLIAADQANTWNYYPSLVPPGFRIDLPGFTRFPVAVQASTDSPGPFRIDRFGHVTVYGSTGGKRLSGMWRWTTADDIPTGTVGSAV